MKSQSRKLILFKKDKQRFLRYFSKKNSVEEEQLKARIMFFSHSIEKGLSRMDLRYGFGKNAITELLKSIEIYNRQGYSLTDSIYLNALSVLNQYILLHREKNYSIDSVFDVSFFTKKYLHKDIKIGGSKKIKRITSDEKKNRTFEELAYRRHSVRDYENTTVDISKINKAIEIALRSPSVCNRQSTRIRVLNNSEIIEKALKIQGGFKGYEIPPCLLMVTTDTRYFIDVTERNQIYVDGGIFAMSLLYALEYEGLAACALNTMFDSKREGSTRKLLTIHDCENLIMYITVGNFKEEYKTPKSNRLTVKEITTYIDTYV